MERALIGIFLCIALLHYCLAEKDCKDCTPRDRISIPDLSCTKDAGVKFCMLCPRQEGEKCGARCGICKPNLQCRKKARDIVGICVKQEQDKLHADLIRTTKKGFNEGCTDTLEERTYRYGERWIKNCTVFSCTDYGEIDQRVFACNKANCDSAEAQHCCTKCHLRLGRVFCKKDEILVRIPKRRGVNTILSRYTLNNPTCMGTETGDDIILRTKLDGCGTTKVFSGDQVKYENNIVLRYYPNETVYRWVKPISCSLPLKFKSKPKGIRVTLKGEGLMMYYTTKGGRILPLKKKQSVTVGDKVYIAIMETKDRGIGRKAVLVDECSLIPAFQGLQKSFKEHLLIKDGCKTAKMIKILRVWKFGIWFSLEARSLFGPDGSLMILKCTAFLCDDALSQPYKDRCKKQCLKPEILMN